MSMQEYRSAPGISPSDLKYGVDFLETFGRTAGSPARLKAKLLGMFPQRKETTSLRLGTFYHDLVLEHDRLEILTEKSLAELTASRMKRKVASKLASYPQKFLYNFQEAKEFKAKHEREATPEEQEALKMLRAERETEASELTDKSPEMIAYRQSKSAEGTFICNPNNPLHKQAYRMYQSLTQDRSNAHVWESLQNAKGKDRVEVSIFCTREIKIGEAKLTVQLKGRPDLIPAGDTFKDFKTCVSAGAEEFSKASARMGYWLQTAQYMSMLNLLADRVSEEERDYYGLGKKSKISYLIQETTPPFEAAEMFATSSQIQAGEHFAKIALSNFLSCYALDDWRMNHDTEMRDTLYPADLCHFIENYATIQHQNANQ